MCYGQGMRGLSPRPPSSCVRFIWKVRSEELIVRAYVAYEYSHRAYWFSKLEQADNKGTDKVSFDTVEQWHLEMEKCSIVDPEKSRQYNHVSEEAREVEMNRMIKVLVCHNFWGQFKAEDAAGKL
jgi:hypothetical protein